MLEAVEQQPRIADQQQSDDSEDEVVDVNTPDHDAAVWTGAPVVQERRDAAGERERDDESEAREHRPFPSGTEVMMEVKSPLELGYQLVAGVRPFGHCVDGSAPRRRLSARRQRPSRYRVIRTPVAVEEASW